MSDEALKPNRKELEKVRRLIGRTIVAAEPNPFDGSDGDGDPDLRSHDWTLTLDDGTRMRFFVEETEVGEYGVDITLSDKPKRGRNR